MQIRIQNLTFETIVGILEEERHTPQTVRLHVKINYDYNGDNFIDYAKVSTFLECEMKQMCYFLVEDALIDLCQKLQNLYPQMRKIKLQIFKPDIVPNAMVGVSHTTYYDQN